MLGSINSVRRSGDVCGFNPSEVDWPNDLGWTVVGTSEARGEITFVVPDVTPGLANSGIT